MDPIWTHIGPSPYGPIWDHRVQMSKFGENKEMAGKVVQALTNKNLLELRQVLLVDAMPPISASSGDGSGGVHIGKDVKRNL